MPWLAISAAPRFSRALTDLLGQVGEPLGAVLGTADVAAQVHGELVDAARDVLVGDGEHRGVHGVRVDAHGDVLVGRHDRQV